MARKRLERWSSIVAANLRAEVARARISQGQVGAWLGLSQSAISARMLGDTPWTFDEVQLVARRLGVDPLRLVAPPTGPE